jgi:RNA methyltransferase, TrmH family
MPITSAQNETYKRLLSLTSAKGLKKEGWFLLSGEKLTREFLQHQKLKVVYEVVTAKMKTLVHAAETLLMSHELFDELDVLGTHFNILVVAQPKMDVLKESDLASYKPKGIEAVIPIGDPGNLGALLRSCEAFGVPRAILTQEAAHPFLPKAVKASAGSVWRLPLCRGPALKDFPANCIALDMKGDNLYSFRWPKNGLLAVGEEGSGLGSAQFKQTVRIPTQGVESLNAVVAASIAFADMSRKRNA